MGTVTGNTLQEPSSSYWYWTELGPDRINLNGATVNLPAGRYEALWDIRGNSGDTFEFEIVAADGMVLLSVLRKIPASEVDDWGNQFFTVPA